MPAALPTVLSWGSPGARVSPGGAPISHGSRTRTDEFSWRRCRTRMLWASVVLSAGPAGPVAHIPHVYGGDSNLPPPAKPLHGRRSPDLHSVIPYHSVSCDIRQEQPLLNPDVRYWRRNATAHTSSVRVQFISVTWNASGDRCCDCNITSGCIRCPPECAAIAPDGDNVGAVRAQEHLLNDSTSMRLSRDSSGLGCAGAAPLALQNTYSVQQIHLPRGNEVTEMTGWVMRRIYL